MPKRIVWCSNKIQTRILRLKDCGWARVSLRRGQSTLPTGSGVCSDECYRKWQVHKGVLSLPPPPSPAPYTLSVPPTSPVRHTCTLRMHSNIPPPPTHTHTRTCHTPTHPTCPPFPSPPSPPSHPPLPLSPSAPPPRAPPSLRSLPLLPSPAPYPLFPNVATPSPSPPPLLLLIRTHTSRVSSIFFSLFPLLH